MTATQHQRPTPARSTRSARSILAIMAGTGGAQLATAVSAPLISRLYSPADIGLFTVVSTIALILGSVAALRFEAAVPLPEREDDAYSVVTLGLLSAGAVGLLGLGATALTADWTARVFAQPGLSSWLYAAPVIAAIIGIFTVLNQHAIRQQRFTAVGRRNALQGFTMAVAQLAAGFAGWKTGGMITGFGIGQGAGAVSLGASAGLASPEARAGRRGEALRRNAARFLHMPLLLTPAGLLNIAGLHAPVLLIAWLYGGEVAGWLGMTQRILALPLSLVGLAIGQVYLGEFARAVREWRTDDARTLFVTASRRLAVAGALLGAVLGVGGPFLFALILGEQWRASGFYAQALAVALAVQLVVSPLSQTLIVCRWEGAQFAWDAGRLAAVVGAVLGAYALTGNPLKTIWAYSMVTALAYLVSWILSRRALNSVGRGGLGPEYHFR